MLYISLSLIFLGLLIFIYSIVVDAKKRHEERLAPPQSPVREVRPGAGEEPKGGGPAAMGGGESAARAQVRSAARRPVSPVSRAEKPSGMTRRKGESPGTGAPPPEADLHAVLYEDSSRAIDYSSESGSIDPSLEKYKHIRRVGGGRFTVEKGGITFQTGATLYRYDFHRLRDLKEGSRHLALFLGGSESVRLFIFNSGNGPIRAAGDAYREYLRSFA